MVYVVPVNECIVMLFWNSVVIHITSACRTTAHAVSNCMNVRASHFIMQYAPTCTASDAGVRFTKVGL